MRAAGALLRSDLCVPPKMVPQTELQSSPVAWQSLIMLCACSAKLFSLLIPEAVAKEGMRGQGSCIPLPTHWNMGQIFPVLESWFSGQKISFTSICARSQKISTEILHRCLEDILDLKLWYVVSALGRFNSGSEKLLPCDSLGPVNLWCWFRFGEGFFWCGLYGHLPTP